jgi:hypothetical protein
MKAIHLLFRRPGIYVYAMFLPWILPYLLREFPIVIQYRRYVGMYAIPFAAYGSLALGLNWIDSRNRFWGLSNRWIHYFVLAGSYFMVSFIALFLTVILDSKGYIACVNEVEASFGMWYWPTAFLALIIGFVWTLILVLIDKRKQNRVEP